MKCCSTLLISLCVLATAPGCGRIADTATAIGKQLFDSSDGTDWPGYGRTFGQQHYSPLAQIDYPSRETMLIAQDAMLLHAALAAGAQGFKGLLYMTTRTVNENSFVSFANPGPDIPGQFYIDSDAVIAELRQLIPSPDELAARHAKPTSNAS